MFSQINFHTHLCINIPKACKDLPCASFREKEGEISLPGCHFEVPHRGFTGTNSGLGNQRACTVGCCQLELVPVVLAQFSWVLLRTLQRLHKSQALLAGKIIIDFVIPSQMKYVKKHRTGLLSKCSFLCETEHLKGSVEKSPT